MPAASVAALVMAAGQGARFGGDLPKQYRSLAGRPPLARIVDAFAANPAVDLVACVIDAAARTLFDGMDHAGKVDLTTEGGATRQESVRSGLEALARLSSPPEIVLIHDAARPIVPAAVIDDLLAALTTADAAAPALPVPDTLSRQADAGFGDEIARDGLVRRQTPQAFRFWPILDAHRRFAATSVTDDVALARAAGLSVVATPGSHWLHKLTTPEDALLLETMLGATGRSRVGNGFDVHRFGPGDAVTLCGVSVPHSHGLIGHSDADVAMHALTDAMLGAAGAGDIGQLFPPSDPQWKGAASKIFLKRARDEITSRGGALEHVDVTIICEAPKVGPYREAMRERLAELLALEAARVNVKATTTEGLGFTGRGEGIAAMATATVWLPG